MIQNCLELNEITGVILNPSENKIAELRQKGLITEKIASELLKRIVEIPARYTPDFVFKNINGDVRMQKLINIFGIEELFKQYDRFRKELIPSLIYNPESKDNKFTNFDEVGVVNSKIKQFKDKITENAIESTVAKETLLNPNYDRNKVHYDTETKIFHTFNDLVMLFSEGLIVLDNGIFKLKFESGLKSGAFRDDDSFADGTKEVPAFAKIYLSTLKDSEGLSLDFVNVQTQYAKLQKHPFYSRLNKDNIYEFVDDLMQVYNARKDENKLEQLKNAHIAKLYPNKTEAQYKAIDRLYSNFIKRLDDNFEALGEANKFLFRMNEDLKQLPENDLKAKYTNLHTSIINAVMTVSEQKYSKLYKKGDDWLEDISGEYKQDYYLGIAEKIQATSKSYQAFTDEKAKKELINSLRNTNTFIRNFLGFDWNDKKDKFYKKYDIQDKAAFEAKLKNEIQGIIDGIEKGKTDYNTSQTDNFTQLIRFKQLIEQGTPTSVTQNINGDAVPVITLTSNMQRHTSLINNLIENNFEMYKNNPFVNGLIDIDFVVAGGIDNGKDKSEYKKLSKEGQLNHDILFKYWNNISKGYVQIMPYEYSDKSKNPYLKMNVVDIHEGGIDNYDKVINLLHKSQQTIYNGQVKGMINQINTVVTSPEGQALGLNPVSNLQELVKLYEQIEEKKLGEPIKRINSNLISRGIDVAPFVENINLDKGKFKISNDYVKHVEMVNDKAKFSKHIKKQIVKDALFLYTTGFKFDNYVKRIIDQNHLANTLINKNGKKGFDYTKAFDEKGITNLNELKEAISGKNPNNQLDTLLNDDTQLNQLFDRVNPLFARYAYDWQLASVNMTQMSEGLIHQYKGKDIHGKWLDSTKRNVFPFANGQAPTFGLRNGIEKQSYAALVSDPTVELVNVLGNYKNQDSEDGVELITEEFLEKYRNSMGRELGNEIGIVLKTITTGFNSNLGTAQKDKNASHTILGEHVRGSAYTYNLLNNMYNQMKYSDIIGNPVTVTIPEHTYAVKQYDVKTNTFSFKVKTKPAKSYEVNSMADIRNKFGEGLLGFDLVVEDRNGDIEANGKRYRYANSRDNESSTQLIINQIEPKLAEIDERLKGYFVSIMPFTSSRKSGATNVNSVKTLTEGNFLLSKQDNTSRFVQLNAYHEVDDHIDITVASQITGAATFNAHTQENKDNARKIYESYADLINFTLQEEFPQITGNITKEGKEFIVKLLEDKTSDLDVINMTGQILSFYGDKVDEVYKSQFVSGKISSSFNSMLSDVIQFKLNGFQAIMGANLTEVYRTDNGKLYNYQDAKLMQEAGVKMSKDRLQAQQFDLIGDVGSVSMYKTKNVFNQFIVRNINQIDENGKVIEGDYFKGNSKAHAKLEQLGRLMNLVDAKNKPIVSDKRLEAEMQQQLNSIVKGELTPVEYYDNYSIQQLHEDLKNEKVSVDEILAKLSTTNTINVTSYNSKPAEIIVPFKWAKQYGIKIGTNINDINVDYFIKQIQDLQKTNPGELQKMINHFTKEYGISDINDIANKQYQSFQKALEVIVGRINKLVSSINSLNLGKLQLAL